MSFELYGVYKIINKQWIELQAMRFNKFESPKNSSKPEKARRKEYIL